MFDPISLISNALRARRAAEDAGSSVDPLDEERRKRREELLDLAKAADGRAAFWRQAQARCAVLDPLRPPFPVPFEQVLRLQDVNTLQAASLRRIAGPPPRVTQISRLSRRGKREQIRGSGVFMRRMVEFMVKICGKPRHQVVATLTGVARFSASMLIVELHGQQHFVEGKTIRARRSRRMFTRVPASETS
jgi:hypothetical protein